MFTAVYSAILILLLNQRKEKQMQYKNFSTFNTGDYIKNSTKNIENILKQNQISSQDIGNINNFVQNSVQSIFNDYNILTDNHSKLPEIPTWESVENAKEIEKYRVQSIENASNAVIMMNLAKNALKRNFDPINTDDENYSTYLNDYISKKERLENLGNGLVDLTYVMSKVDKSRGQQAKNIMERLGLTLPQQNSQVLGETTANPHQTYNGSTGGASDIKNSAINKVKNYIDHGGENGNPIWFLPETYNSSDKRDGNWIEYLRLWPETNKRLDKFYERPDINITNKEKDIKNDMRHIVGPALFAQLYGSETSRLLSYLKESRDILLQRDLKDSIVDMKNNDLGVQIGLKYPNMSRDELIELIYERYVKQKRNK